MTRPTFGQDVPCRPCKGSGLVRGSGMDDRQRADLRKRGEPVPTMRRCDTCGGSGIVPPTVADR
jgi:hypothetical protein